ncbi:MAG: type I restriction-modification system subunit M N-terminal domain-containing protein, partial [Candidatus Rokubacteria bacterium]|nr:type I restriction-modification system subunit M N-terminal domain-containing protein [Candidatus Rokubacteria bacterium]
MARKHRIDGLIKDLRERLDVTQVQLAGLLKVSLPTIQRWERGRTRPDALALHVIEEFLKKQGPTYADLLTGHFGAPVPASPAAARRGRRREAMPTVVVEGEARPKLAAKAALDVKSMEGMLWKAACGIRGEKDAPKFKDYILPLIFVKRLSDVFDDEIARLTETYGSPETARTVLEADPSLVRFYLPPEATWPVVSGRTRFDWPAGRRPRTLGEQLTQTVRAIARANPTLQGVIDTVDYNETRNGEREVSDEALGRLIETLSDPRYRLGLADVEPDFLGRAYEYLLRKFAEG